MTPAQVYARARAAATISNRRRRRRLFGAASVNKGNASPSPLSPTGIPGVPPKVGPFPLAPRRPILTTGRTNTRSAAPMPRGVIPAPAPRTATPKSPGIPTPRGPVGEPNDGGRLNSAGQGVQAAPHAGTPIVTTAAGSTLAAASAALSMSNPGNGSTL